jgi:hypothetical protein
MFVIDIFEALQSRGWLGREDVELAALFVRFL